ncbi:MAG: 50S ribosome-binding GTPase, partial [Methanomicrobiales archaeon]|nr:50S ribosome-binding GTPase [Methanomicrobiales archaeon]
MRIALIGNPNVGKSLIFTQLTGVGVEISNYPGTTIEMKSGATCVQRDIHELIDLPGIYTLDGTSEEEVLVR